MEKSQKAIQDLVIGSIFTLIGLIAIMGARSLPEPTYEPLGPAFFPRMLGYMCIILSLILLITSSVKIIKFKKDDANKKIKLHRKSTSDEYRSHPLLGVFMIALLFVYVYALDAGLSGFRTLTIIFVIILGSILTKIEFKRKLFKRYLLLALLTLCLSFGLHYLFVEIFTTNLY